MLLRNRTAFKLPLLIFLAVTTSAYAQNNGAEEPLVTDRPDLADSSVTVGHLVTQVEFGFLWERPQGEGPDVDAVSVPLLLRFGIGDDFELRLESGTLSGLRTTSPTGNTDWESGFAPVDIGFKYHVKDAGASPLDPSLGVQLMIGPPAGSGPFRSDSTSVTFKLSGDFDFAPASAWGPTSASRAAMTLRASATRPRSSARRSASISPNPPGRSLNSPSRARRRIATARCSCSTEG